MKSSCYLQTVPVSIQPKTCYSLVSEGVDHVPAKLVKENHLVGWKLQSFHYHVLLSASSIQNKFQPIQAKVLFMRARSHLVRTRCCLKFVSIGAQQVKVAKNENRAEKFGNYWQSMWQNFVKNVPFSSNLLLSLRPVFCKIFKQALPGVSHHQKHLVSLNLKFCFSTLGWTFYSTLWWIQFPL